MELINEKQKIYDAKVIKKEKQRKKENEEDFKK